VSINQSKGRFNGPRVYAHCLVDASERSYWKIFSALLYSRGLVASPTQTNLLRYALQLVEAAHPDLCREAMETISSVE
jgi:hypothetical protein